MKHLIELVPVPEQSNKDSGGTNFPIYCITLGGIQFGVIRRYGGVWDNQGLNVSYNPIEGISKLLDIPLEDAREVFNRELIRLTPNWKGLP